MSLTILNSFISISLASAAILATTPVTAAEFPQATAAARLSLTQGLSHTSLPLLQRSGDADAKAVTASLIQNFCAAPCAVRNSRLAGTTLHTNGDHWTMQISHDGTAGQFQNSEVAARLHSLAKARSQKMTTPALEKAGRAFISAKLASVITLEPNDQLVPLSTAYRIEGGQDSRTHEMKESVVANRVVFGRTLNGVPVVGGGSTVAVTFANDGSVESFRYDWPKYRATTDQNIVDNVEIFHRLQQALGARTSAPVMKFSAARAGEASAYPVALSSDTTLQKLECGYFDPGFAARDAKAPVQTGCVYHVVSQEAHGMRRGFAGAVPAGTQIQPDAAWTEAHIVAGTANATKSIVPGPSRNR